MSSTSDSHRGGNLSPEYALLGFLLAGPGYGYELHQQFTAELGQVWHLSQSQAYAILNRLERRGDISAHLMEQQKLPARQVLRITASGRRRFIEWLESGISTNARGIRLEFLTRLYFIQRYDPQKTVRIYQAQELEINRSIKHLKTLLAGLSADQKFNRLSIELRLRQMKLIQSWMQEIGIQFHIEEKESV